MNTYKVSICILGDSYSGKTTFLNYVDKGFFLKNVIMKQLV